MPRDGLRRKPPGAELRARIHRIRRQKKSTISPMRTVPLTTAYRPRSPVATAKAMADNDADAYSPILFQHAHVGKTRRALADAVQF